MGSQSGSGQLRIGVMYESRSGLFCVIDDCVGSVLGGFPHRLVAGADHQITPNQQVGLSGGYSDGLDISLLRRHSCMTHNGAKFLRQARLIQRRAAFPLNVGGHGD